MQQLFSSLLIIFSVSLLGNDAFIKLCCPKHDQSSMQKDLSLILIPKQDNVYQEKGCHNIFTSKNREKIISSLVRMKYKSCDFNSTLSPTGQNVSECKLEIEAREENLQQNRDLGYQHPSVIAGQTNQRSKGQTTYQINTLNNKMAEISIDQNQVRVKCQVNQQKTNYSLEIFVNSNQNGNNSSTNTSLTLSPGQKREISSLFNQSQNQSHNFDLSRGFMFRRNKSTNQRQYFIYLKP